MFGRGFIFIFVFFASATLSAGGPNARIKTNLGDIIIQLEQERAPISVSNFLNYVRSGSYDGTIFHRVIPGFMVQGGGTTVICLRPPREHKFIMRQQMGSKMLGAQLRWHA